MYIFPTLEETEGIVLLEALAAKANVIVRDIPVFDWLNGGTDCYKAKDKDEFERMIKEINSIITITVATDYVFAYLPHYEGDEMLAAIFGGLLIGAGLGLCYSREGTGGGTDILNRLIYKRFPQISIGAITFATDFAVIVFATCVFGKIESALYAIIAIFVSSKMIDIIVYGSYEGKMLLIFSDKSEEIAQKIMTAGKGVTFLSGKGAYSGDEKQVICCAVRKNDYVKVKRYVKEVDESAFMIITSAKEVLGKGFKEIN